MDTKRFSLVLSLVSLTVGSTLAIVHFENGETQQMNCKYMICLLYPTTEIIEGKCEKDTFERLFQKDYVMSGERISPPTGRAIEGFLAASDGQSLVVVPIVHWVAPSGKQMYLCQGTNEPGKAPAFSALAESRESVIKRIKEQLREIK